MPRTAIFADFRRLNTKRTNCSRERHNIARSCHLPTGLKMKRFKIPISPNLTFFKKKPVFFPCRFCWCSYDKCNGPGLDLGEVFQFAPANGTGTATANPHQGRIHKAWCFKIFFFSYFQQHFCSTMFKIHIGTRKASYTVVLASLQKMSLRRREMYRILCKPSSFVKFVSWSLYPSSCSCSSCNDGHTSLSCFFLKMLQSTFIFPHKVIFFLFAHTVIHHISQQTFVYLWWFWEGWRGVEFHFFFSSFVFIISYHSVKTIFVGFIFFSSNSGLFESIIIIFGVSEKQRNSAEGEGIRKRTSFKSFFLRRAFDLIFIQGEVFVWETITGEAHNKLFWFSFFKLSSLLLPFGRW